MKKSHLKIAENKPEKKVWFILLVALVVISGTSPVALGVITSNPLLPPDTGVYVSQEQVFATYQSANSEIIATDAVLDSIADSAVRTQFQTVHEIEQFNLIFTADFTFHTDGSPIGPNTVVWNGPVVTITQNKWGVTTGIFNAEIVSMDLSGDVAGQTLSLRESPALSSLGQTVITDLGGGLYDIESFFDLFTEVSVDGGQSWISCTDSVRMELVPEPATFLLFSLGALMLRRRRRRS